MSRGRRSVMQVIKAFSSPIRLKVLSLLYNRGSLSYTEIMNRLQLNPTRDAGRFAYHLKLLLDSRLIEPDASTKKYKISELGREVVNVTEEIKKRVQRKRKILVRTSRSSVEEFDRNKIMDSLVKEAEVPVDLAHKIARETEKRIYAFKMKYLTAPLIRELTNAVLIEQGLEEYRHKLTRLGLPVYDVAELIRVIGERGLGVYTLNKTAGDAVFEEYTLLNILPRDVADAHLSGALHLENLQEWILKPSSISHDLRFFFKNGLEFGVLPRSSESYPPPKNLDSALLMVSNLIKITAREVSGEQLLDYFNLFLAPFTKDASLDRLRYALSLFLDNINQSVLKEGFAPEVSLGLELTIPKFIGEKRAFGPGGKIVGSYSDFYEESLRIASVLLDLAGGSEDRALFFNPSLIVKVRPDALSESECESVFFEAHKIAAETGLPYFANLNLKRQEQASYMASASRLDNSWREDWELDTLRTGIVGKVSINLPRVSYDSNKKRSSLLRILSEQVEMALRALKIKRFAIKRRKEGGLLPFLSQKRKKECYFRDDNASNLINLIGLDEMIRFYTEKSVYEEGGDLKFVNEVFKWIIKLIEKYNKSPKSRIGLSSTSDHIAAERLARLDVEKYGWSRVKAEGSREAPFYSNGVLVPLSIDIEWKERLKIEGVVHRFCNGGHMALIQLIDEEQEPEGLVSATKYIISRTRIGMYTYNRNLSYCSECKRTWIGLLPKCPNCSSTEALVKYSRLDGRYRPLSLWPSTMITSLGDRKGYLLIS